MHSRSVQFNIVTERRPGPRRQFVHLRSLHTFTKLFHCHFNKYRCHITLSPWTQTPDCPDCGTCVEVETLPNCPLYYPQHYDILSRLHKCENTGARYRQHHWEEFRTVIGNAEGVSIRRSIDGRMRECGRLQRMRARSTCGARLYTELWLVPVRHASCDADHHSRPHGLPTSTADCTWCRPG